MYAFVIDASRREQKFHNFTPFLCVRLMGQLSWYKPKLTGHYSYQTFIRVYELRNINNNVWVFDKTIELSCPFNFKKSV